MFISHFVVIYFCFIYLKCILIKSPEICEESGDIYLQLDLLE